MQAIFSIKNGYVICQSEEHRYADSLDNFILDFGSSVPSNVTEIDYNQTLGNCFINGIAFQPFPNEFAENVLKNVNRLISNKELRNHKEITEEEQLLNQYETEISEKEQWLRDHDYIGVKIATGRATLEEYSAEIATMGEYAKRIEELREIIASLKN